MSKNPQPTAEQLKLVTSPAYGVKLTASQTGKSFQRTYALGADYLLELLSETPGSGYVAVGT